MSSFDDRQKAQEAKFVLDAEQQFKADARRNKLVGAWAAGLLGRDDVDAYASEVVKADFEEAGVEDIVRKISADFAAGNVSVSDDDIRAKIEEFAAEAAAAVAG